VVGVVDPFRLRALHADRALGRPADHDRHAQIGARAPADPGTDEIGFLVDDQRLARLDDLAGQALARLLRHELVAVLVRELGHAGLPVVQRDVGDVRLEHGADLLADQLDEVAELELAGELLRDRVDRGELRRALLRLGEQARILDGDRRLERESLQEFQVGVGERLAARAPHGHRALHRLAGAQRRHHHRRSPPRRCRR
jgi:hypothetical protein